MKINYRQMSVMLFMSFISLKFLVLPSVLFRYSENMSWLVTLTLMLIDTLYAFIIISLMRKSNYKNINEFMQNTLGTFLTKVCLVLLAVQFALQVGNMTKGLEFFVVENFYNNFSFFLNAIIFA